MGGCAVTETAECRACHRPIADVAAAKKRDGLGPKCWRKRQPVPIGALVPRVVASIRRRAGEIVPGQQEIEIEGASE